MATSSVREQILVYLANLLTNASGFTFYRSRETPVTREEGLVGILEPEAEEADYQAMGRILRTFTARVTVIARASAANAAADSVADAAIVSIFAAIMKDQTLGGLCGVITDESTTWEQEEADRNAARVEIRFRIRYATLINDLTTQA